MLDTHVRLLSTPWFVTPGTLGEGVQLFAVGDVHGQGRALENALARIHTTPRLAAERVVLFLGDLIDRGPDSFACLDMARHAAELAGCDKAIMLAGNHEIMLAQGLQDPATFLEGWILCGGESVLPAVGVADLAQAINVGMATVAQRLAARLPEGWATQILSQAGHWTSGDVLCVHAGIHPHKARADFLHQRADAPGPMDTHWAWIREPFLSWPQGWDPLGKTVVIHGHTPAVSHWIGSDADLAQLAPLDKRRICLDADAGARAQVAWCEWVGRKARVSCIQIGRDDAF